MTRNHWCNTYMSVWLSWSDVLLFSSSERVGADPGVGYGDAGGEAEAGQVGRQGSLQQVRVPAHRVLRLTHIQTLGEETRVVCWREFGIQDQSPAVHHHMGYELMSSASYSKNDDNVSVVKEAYWFFTW